MKSKARLPTLCQKAWDQVVYLVSTERPQKFVHDNAYGDASILHSTRVTRRSGYMLQRSDNASILGPLKHSSLDSFLAAQFLFRSKSSPSRVEYPVTFFWSLNERCSRRRRGRKLTSYPPSNLFHHDFQSGPERTEQRGNSLSAPVPRRWSATRSGTTGYAGISKYSAQISR